MFSNGSGRDDTVAVELTGDRYTRGKLSCGKPATASVSFAPRTCETSAELDMQCWDLFVAVWIVK